MSSSHPVRTCVGCRRTDDPAAMTRYVLRDGLLTVDPSGHAPGRGAWVHPDPGCWQAGVRRGGFSRSFRSRVRYDGVGRRPCGD